MKFLVEKFLVNDYQNLETLKDVASVIRPWNRSDLLRRLRSYHSRTWFAKPDIISAPVCASYGWINEECDTLYCQSCKQTLKHLEVDDQYGTALLKALSTAHDSACGWRDNHCDLELLCTPYIPPSIVLSDIRRRVMAIRSIGEQELTKLCVPLPQQIMSMVKPGTDGPVQSNMWDPVAMLPRILCNTQSSPAVPVAISNAMILSLFGWTVDRGLPSPTLKCETCERQISLGHFSDRPLDPVSQHTSWCPWVHTLPSGLKRERNRSERTGYISCLQSILPHEGLLETGVEQDMQPTDKLWLENAYKRVRNALSLA